MCLCWYRYASEYGERYGRAAGWLLFFFAAFVLLYPAIGLEDAAQAGQSAVLPYETPANPAGEDPAQMPRARLELPGKSLVTTLQGATFRRDIKYPPAGAPGGFCRAVQVRLFSTLFARLLLAGLAPDFPTG